MLEEIADVNPEALFADGFEDALIGYLEMFGKPPVATYDRDKCIKILMKDMSEEDAIEYFEFNVIGSWVGENTPAFVRLL